MNLISIILISILSINLIHGTLATPLPPSGTEVNHRSSISSSRSGLSDQERLADLERRTHDLLLRNDQFARHNSFDHVTSEPPSSMRFGGSYLSLPDLNQANTVIEAQPYDWLTPRAEAQVNEFFPLMNALDPMASSVSSASSQYSPHSHSPIDNIPQQRRMSMTPRQQQGIPPPPPSRPHICDQCKTGFLTKQELRHHSIEHHIDNEERITYTCPVCDTEFLGRTTLINAHLPTHYKHDTTYQDIRLRLG